MAKTSDFLVEIGTEELPPKSLKRLSDSFKSNLIAQMKDAQLTHGDVQAYATPRRLALWVKDLQTAQANQDVLRLGPNVKSAFDAEGNPTAAATGFAKKYGVSVSDLNEDTSGKQPRLSYLEHVKGQATKDLLESMTRESLHKLPISKPMRWGSNTAEFIRPVHWVLMIFDDKPVNAELFGLQTDNKTYGHRFHAPKTFTIKKPADYARTLEKKGYVIADTQARAEMITAQSAKLTHAPVIEPALLDEVTALVEWPVALMGQFDHRFLSLPKEVLISVMAHHQKYFHVLDAQHLLQPNFITISNIDSKDPALVTKGNEKVIHARLCDAEFFYSFDLKHKLNDAFEPLKHVVFQQQLGSVYDRCERIAALAKHIAEQTAADTMHAERAGRLSKTDLVSTMVGEFPELQGIIGAYYAEHQGEAAAVSTAIREQYLPRFSGDALPETPAGCAVAIANKLDLLVGIFGINQQPTGEKDPFALRRAALGLVRILIEGKQQLNLRELLTVAAGLYGDTLKNANTIDEVLNFVLDRMCYWYGENGVTPDIVAAVNAVQITAPLDFDRRVQAVRAFKALPEAAALAEANKRVLNILKKQDESSTSINDALLADAAEQALAQQLTVKAKEVHTLETAKNYQAILSSLASLQTPVDTFFNEVMVMCDDADTRTNRLALLNNLRGLFLTVADISHLQ